MSRRMASVVTTSVLLGIVLLLVGVGTSQVPRKINYQMRITDSVAGEPEPGPHEIIFRILEQESGGAAVWDETHNVNADTTGVVAVILGSTDPIDIALDGPVWLEVEVDGEVLNPRREIVSVPFAFRAVESDNADSLGGIYSGDYADSAHDHDDRYYTQGELNTAGSLNDTGNPVDWTKLKNVPGGLADGTDDTGPGDGYSLDAADGNPVDAVYVDNDGDVGIGTTSPTADLHLRGSNPKVLIDATGDDSEIQFKSSGDGAAQVWTVYKDSATDDLRFNQNGDKVTIDNSTGNVGIGTTSPSAGKLQVQSSGDAVYAKSSGSTGIFAVAGTAVGGEADGAVVGTSTTRSAVIGYSTGGAGVVGHSSGATIPAVAGYHSGDGPAIYGSCSGAYPCLEGSRTDAGTVVGAYGNDGVAVLGYTSSASGIPVVGYQTGYTTADIGSWWKPGGYFAGRNGVVGLTNEPGGYAVLGISKNTNSWAGVFMGDGNGVAISTPGGKTGLTVSGGSKAAVVATADGARSLYCEEASEVWFADYGFGRLEDGLAVIAIDPVFAETVNLGEPYHVFLQAYGDADLYVSSRDEHTFEVRLRDGDPAAEFSYRLVAKRLGYEVERLTRVPWADNDANLFPGRAAHLQGED